MTTAWKLCLAILGGISLMGCANPSEVDLNLKDLENEKLAYFWPKQCTVRFNPKVTHIPDQQNFGLVSYRKLSIKEVESWIENAFAYPGSDRTRSADIYLDVKKMYIQNSATSLVGNIIVTYQVRQSGEIISEKTRLGYKSAMNWNNGDNEIIDIFQGALKDVAAKIEKDIDQLCSLNAAL